MDPRPTIAVILRVLVLAAFQFLSYKTYGLTGVVVAWAVIVITTWIDVKTTKSKIAQTAVQTAWFIFILGVVHTNQLSF